MGSLVWISGSGTTGISYNLFGLFPLAFFNPFPFNSISERKRQFPPFSEIIFTLLTFPFSHSISNKNPPRARNPWIWPSSQRDGRAGRR